MSNEQFDLSQFRDKLPEFNLRALKWFTILGIVISALATSFYSIPADSRGVILRFGKQQPTMVRPGLHFKLPYFIDRVYKVPVERQLKQEFGFSTRGATNNSQARPDSQAQSQMAF